MSPRLASDLLPVFIVIFACAFLAAYVFICHMARKGWRWLVNAWRERRENPSPVPARDRRRYPFRLAWYQMTHRMPRYRGRPGDRWLRPDVDEAVEFGKIAGLIRQRGIYADDPQRRQR